MFLADRLALGKPRKTSDGYLAVRARAARTGVQDYLGREIDPTGKHFKADEVVGVYRPETEVFAKDSVASFLMKPITNDHPTTPVTADNWQRLAKGIVGQALRDGDHLAFDLVLMDAATIADVDAGKRELSNGYQCELTIGDGVAPDGKAYRATQTRIRGNHVALVDQGRAGPKCRIGDAAVCDALPHEMIIDGQTYNARSLEDKNAHQRRDTVDYGANKMPHVLIIDGLQVPNVSDEAKAAIEKLQGQVRDAATASAAAATKAGEDAVAISTKDGEIAALTKKLEDAQISPDKLQQLVADRAVLIGKAKAAVPSVVTDGKTDAEIRRAVVVASLGDAATKDMDDNAIGGAFAALTKDGQVDPVRRAIADGAVAITDTAVIRDAARSSRYAN